jgi:hypothetical protein
LHFQDDAKEKHPEDQKSVDPKPTGPKLDDPKLVDPKAVYPKLVDSKAVDTKLKTKKADKPVDPKSVDKNRVKRDTSIEDVDKTRPEMIDNDIEDDDEDFKLMRRSQNFFNQPRTDRSSWQVPYPRMGKKSTKSMIPMARLGRSNVIPMAQLGRSPSMIPMARLGRSSSMIPMARLGRSSNMIPMARFGRSSSMIPMARLGRSSQGLVIPMARMGRSTIPGYSMIPMARLGRSAPSGNIKEEMVPLYLPNSGYNPNWKIDDILENPEDFETLVEILNEYLRVYDEEKSELDQGNSIKEMEGHDPLPELSNPIQKFS